MHKNQILSLLTDRFWEIRKETSNSKQDDSAAIFASFSKFILLLLDTLPDLFWAKDMEDRYLFVNKAICEKLLKCDTPDEPLGKTDLYFAQREKNRGYTHTFGDICVNSDHAVKRSGKPEQFLEEGKVRGEYLFLDVYKAPVFDETGKMIATVGCGRDITRARQIEIELENTQKKAAENEKNVLISQVVGKMAHDFNNILGAVMGLSELALLDCHQEEIRQYLQDILLQMERGRSVTRNLITFAKDKKPYYSRFCIKDKIEKLFNLLHKDLEGISIDLEICKDIDELNADPDMFETAITNILMNSIHAVSRTDNPKIGIKISQKESAISFIIEDNGCGIPHEYRDRIYDPAFSLKGGKDVACCYQPGIKGTGYGLSNAKSILDKHGGEIFFDSEPFKLTRFVLCFPVFPENLMTEKNSPIEIKEILKKRRILLVEDEHSIAHVQSMFLSAEPFKHSVDIAYSGRMAMNFYKQKKYDLISLDYLLQGEYNGLDLYHYIRKQEQTIPVLLISGNVEFIESIQRLLNTDKHLAYLSKPCRNVEYIEAINRLLIGHSS